jgi:Zn-finger nucleic acid-binding protein
MQCPVCTTERLVISDRQGIEIDYCPKCRGVWLDRGELDKIIDRAAAEVAPPPRAEPPRAPEPPPRHYEDRPRHAHYEHRRDYDDDDYYRRYGKRKRKGFLGDLFDFD